MPGPVHLPERIEIDAHNLFLHLMADDDRRIIVFADSREYADGVMVILEGLYPGASERVEFDIAGRWPGTTG